MTIDNSVKYSDFPIENNSKASSPFLYHVTHIESAVSILIEDRICAWQLNEDPKLADLTGVWLTPNTWADGSFYGNIRFGINIVSVVESYRFYWIGISKWYDERTCNFIISTDSLDGRGFTSYDIQDSPGPLRFRNGSLERNSSCNIHIIHNGSVPMNKINNLSTIDHHGERCLRSNACEKLNKITARRLLIAQCLKESRYIPNILLEDTEAVIDFLEHLYSIVSFGKTYKADGLNGNDANSLELAKKIVDQYAMSAHDGDLKLCKSLSENFSNALLARNAIVLYIKRYIGEKFVMVDREDKYEFGTGNCFA